MSGPFRLSRRTVLRGAGGVAIALPWLEIMAPEQRSFAATTPALRFLSVFQPNGTVLERWRPTGTETSFTLSPILSPLEEVKSHFVVLDGIDMSSAVGESTQSGMVALLTGTEQGGTGQYAQGPSLDQVLASRLAGSRSLRSLSLAIRWGTGKAHGQVSPIDILNYEEGAAFSPIPPRLDPEQVWTELFGMLGPGDGGWERSILDSVGSRYAALAPRLGAADRARLEQHLEKIRELELGVQATCSAPARADTTGYNPASGLNSADDGSIKDLTTDGMIPAVGRFMIDMLVMAFACDLTAVGTLQWSDAESKYTLPWLGLTEHQRFYMNDGGWQPTEYERIATWYSEQHAYLVRQMAAVDMGGHTLLDESVVFFGTNLQSPPTYSKVDMPFLLAGNGGGLRTGRYLTYNHPSHNDLLVALANLCGDPRTTFGDPEHCTGALPNLT